MSLSSSKRKQRNAKFIECAFDGHHQEVERLLKEGVDLEAVDHSGYTALSEASVAGQTIVVGQLLRALANPNTRAHDGRTPLHRAAFHGWLPVIRLLLDHGADPSIRDGSAHTPADLARNASIREVISTFPREKTCEAQETRKQKLRDQPPPPTALEEEEQASAQKTEADAAVADKETKTSSAGELGGDTTTTEENRFSFDPAPRSGPADAAKEKSSGGRAKPSPSTAKADRERKYQEAMAELAAQYGSSESEEASAEAFALQQNMLPLTARVEVVGCGETRLNGVYQVQNAQKERIEFTKVDDELCQIFWSEWQDEWRMLIADYKMASVLYRHSYRPNWKADVCHGVPEQGWQKWFGKGSEPKVRHLPEEDPEAASDAAAVPRETLEADRPEADVTDAESTANVMTETSAESKKPVPKTEFLELHSKLDIVKVDEGAARRAAEPTSIPSQTNDILQVGLGGDRIVETADGLFSDGELKIQEADAAGSVETSEALAQAWLQRLGSAVHIPPKWDAVNGAKSTSQELYAAGKVAEACQVTCAAIESLRMLGAAISRGPCIQDERQDDKDGEEDQPGDGEPAGHIPCGSEIKALGGVLHSNRSLLLLQMLQAEHQDLAAFGAEAAWRLIVSDTDRALQVDPSNFKASFRRARALLELGELDEALADATRVVDHYARNSATPNPEAAALRERILEAIRLERGKWGQKDSARWNRAVAKDLITEVNSLTAATKDAAQPSSNDGQARTSKLPWEAAPASPSAQKLGRRAAAVPSTPSAPRSASDVEKAIMVTFKRDKDRQLAYVREHLSADLLCRLYRKASLGPDLLGTFVHVLAALAAESPEGTSQAGELLAALAKTPSALTHAEMFDASERAALQGLLSHLGPQAAAVWSPDTE